MRRLTGAAALAAALTVQIQPAYPNDATAAAIAAGIAGVAVGAAIANHHHHSHPGGHFTPKPGVTCYNKQRACYHDDGSFAANATWEYF
ncbi:hypothetical protein [Amaricoccus sp.]|uniref:hypothetical protein n=1 Tax=Amaricoccus sp. TaxID=1872485 RepID=UPI001B61153B|nr:hypothetical protein [Amaricoccus sp.]MBP7001034.1 hypothetical protein [Amaricoccus sp.]